MKTSERRVGDEGAKYPGLGKYTKIYSQIEHSIDTFKNI